MKCKKLIMFCNTFLMKPFTLNGITISHIHFAVTCLLAGWEVLKLFCFVLFCFVLFCFTLRHWYLFSPLSLYSLACSVNPVVTTLWSVWCHNWMFILHCDITHWCVRYTVAWHLNELCAVTFKLVVCVKLMSQVLLLVDVTLMWHQQWLCSVLYDSQPDVFRKEWKQIGCV